MSRVKSLASDTLIYGVFTTVGRFLTFLLTPLYTNYLSKEAFADIGYIFALIAFMNIIYGFGMDSAYFRFYSPDDKNSAKKVFTNTYLAILGISILITIVIIIFADNITPMVTDLPDGKMIILLASLMPLLDSMMIVPFSYLRISRQAKKFAMTRFSLVIIAVGLNFLFVVYLRWGAKGVLYSQVLANLAGAAFFAPLVLKNLSLNIDFKLLKEMLRFGLPTLPAMLSGMILQVGDRWILKPLVDVSQFALYQCNHKLGIPMMLFVSVFEYAWKPFYLSHFNDKDAKQLYSRVLTYFTFISAGLFLIAGLFMDFLVRMPFIGGRFINPEYWSGMGIIPIILAGYYFNGVFNNVACGFQIEKKTEYLPLVVGIAAVVNIALNFLLIPYFGIWGSAWATLIAFFVSAAILYLYSRKIYPISYEWFRLIKIILLTGSIYAASMLVTQNMSLANSFIIRISGLILFLILISTMGFFTKGELNRIKSLFRRKVS